MRVFLCGAKSDNHRLLNRVQPRRSHHVRTCTQSANFGHNLFDSRFAHRYNLASLTGSSRDLVVAGMKREAGENPAQGRYCIRREVQANCHCNAQRKKLWEGRLDIVNSRKSEDLPVKSLFGASDPGNRQAPSPALEPSSHGADSARRLLTTRRHSLTRCARPGELELTCV